MSSRCMHWVLWWGWLLHWEERISGAVCHLLYIVSSYDIGERCSVQDEENGPQYWTLSHAVHELWCWRRRVSDWLKWTDTCLRGMTETIGVQYVDWMPKRVDSNSYIISVCMCVCVTVCASACVCVCVGGVGVEGSLVCAAACVSVCARMFNQLRRHMYVPVVVGGGGGGGGGCESIG